MFVRVCDDVQGNSAVINAAQEGHLEVVKVLVEAKCNIDQTNEDV